MGQQVGNLYAYADYSSALEENWNAFDNPLDSQPQSRNHIPFLHLVAAALVSDIEVPAGLELIKQLIDSPKWERIVSLGRRELPLPAEYKVRMPCATYPCELRNSSSYSCTLTIMISRSQTKSVGKLQQRNINFDNVAAEGQGAFERADVVFCTLGTTRGKAGSAESFIRVHLLTNLGKQTASVSGNAGTGSRDEATTCRSTWITSGRWQNSPRRPTYRTSAC